MTTEILPGVHALEGTMGFGYREYGYIITWPNFSILIDVTHKRFLNEVKRFQNPKYLILTHGHATLDESLYERELGTQVFLHPADIHLAAPTGKPEDSLPANVYWDPLKSTALAALGFQFFHVPGHTSGSQFVFLSRAGGLLFPGDSVVGPKADASAADAKIHFPPSKTSDNEKQLFESLARIKIPRFSSFLPLHGEPVLADQNPEQMLAELIASISVTRE